MARKAKRPTKAELWDPLFKQARDYSGKPDATAYAVCRDTGETIALIRVAQGKGAPYVLAWFGAFGYIQTSPDEFEADNLPKRWRYRWRAI